jgi:hypothetical protein
VSAGQLTREQVLDLPPVVTLATLARALGVSEPTVRAAHRSGELEHLGIKVNRIGVQHRVVTASLHAYLGLDGDSSALAPGESAGQDRPLSSPLRPVRGGGAGTARRDVTTASHWGRSRQGKAMT